MTRTTQTACPRHKAAATRTSPQPATPHQNSPGTATAPGEKAKLGDLRATTSVADWAVNRPESALFRCRDNAEPGTGGPDPFPAVTGLGGGSDVGQSRLQLGQLEAPLGPRVKVPAGGGFVKEPSGFAVVIWAVHSLSSVVVPGPSSQGY